MKHIITASMFALAACSSPATFSGVQDTFFLTLSTYCGKAFTGQLVSTDEADADFGKQSMVMHVRTCSENEIRIPFHVGEDRSRTWVISRTAEGLRLKHDHRHEDGSEDAVTQYGGDTGEIGTELRQSFPADQFSKDLFAREGLDVSVDNVWAVEVDPNTEAFAYELTRPNRLFRVEFDLSHLVEPPPPPWGAE